MVLNVLRVLGYTFLRRDDLLEIQFLFTIIFNNIAHSQDNLRDL